MKLTRDQAIREFRKMWEWIADETIRRRRKVEKYEYFKENGIPYVKNDCFLCEYTLGNDLPCTKCQIDFDGRGGGCCDLTKSAYQKWKWIERYDYIEASSLAREIARLPEKKGALL